MLFRNTIAYIRGFRFIRNAREQETVKRADINPILSEMITISDSKEDSSNKQTDLTPSAIKFPTVDAVNVGLSTKQKTITSGTAAPSEGVDGDIYLQYI